MKKMRTLLAKRFDTVRLIAAILIGVLFAIVIICLISKQPWDAIGKLFFGPFQSVRRFGNVIELMIPLTFSGLSVAVMFTAEQFNMGTEGAFYAGGALASIIALELGGIPFVTPFVAILAGAVAGGIICFFSGFLKIKFGTSELVCSLMLNYVVFYIFKYIMFSGPYKDARAGYVATYFLPEEARLSPFIPKTNVHTGLFILIVFIVLMHLYINKTTWGFALRVTGENRICAKYIGISVPMVILSSQFIGGILGGIGGAVQVLGLYERFRWVALPGFGFDGIIVSILARKKPILIPISAFFLAYLRIGSDVMSSSTDVTNELISIIQSIIILFVSAEVFLEKYRQKLIVKEAISNE